MKQTFQTKAAQFLKETEKRKRWRRVVVSLALVVAMLTGNLLMLPAVTMETETECGLTAHAHTEECYTTELTCPLPVSEVYVPAHTHTDECKGEQESVLTCTVEPYAAHTHDETCYGVACGQEEWEAHTHGDGCYEAEEYLACDIPLGHKHTDACYEHVDERICGQEEGDGAHTHGDGCYTEGELSCGTAESAGHVHGDGCWQSIKTDTLSCTLEETDVHEHSKESCYDTRDKLVCAKQEGDGHAHDENCIGLVCELTAGPGHVHEDGCYGLQDTYICGQEETQEIQIHAHDESCYAQVLDCALPEHEHTAQCYGTLYCGAGEHVHGDECYAEEQLVCDKAEHQHEDACYEMPEKLAALAAMIDALPTEEEYVDALAEFGDDMDACVAYSQELLDGELGEAYNAYMSLSDAEKAMLPQGEAVVYLYEYIVALLESAAVTLDLPAGISYTPEQIFTIYENSTAVYNMSADLDGLKQFVRFTTAVQGEHNGLLKQEYIDPYVLFDLGQEVSFTDYSSIVVAYKANEPCDGEYMALYLVNDNHSFSEDWVLRAKLNGSADYTDDDLQYAVFRFDTPTTGMKNAENKIISTHTGLVIDGFRFDFVDDHFDGDIWDNDTKGVVDIYSITIVQNDTAISSAARSDDIETVTKDIDFKLFNYSKDINGDFTNKKNVSHYFTFRDSVGNEYTGDYTGDEVVYENKQTDADGYTANRTRVDNKLKDAKFPQLSKNDAANFNGASLEFLFSVGNAVTAYDPINTILQKNGTHYTYSSARNAVDYDIETNRFNVRNYAERNQTTADYDKADGSFYGDFMPFTYTNGNICGAGSKAVYHVARENVDYWYGMTMKFDFKQTAGGQIDGEDMIFHFSGDDDVWVYIDNVLVLDLGGTHGTVDGYINFRTGEVKQYLSWGGKTEENTDTSNPTTLKDCFDAAGIIPNGGWNEDDTTFADWSQHTIKFFYLERGAAVANCVLDFNMPVIPTNSLTVEKQAEDNELLNDTRDFTFQVLDDNGEVTFEGESYDIYVGENKVDTGMTDAVTGMFTIKAGQRAQFSGITVDQGNFSVRELIPEEDVDEFDYVTVGGSEVNGVPIKVGDVNYVAYGSLEQNIDGGSALYFMYVNNFAEGDLTIAKEVERTDGSDDTSGSFDFKVELEGVSLADGTTYQVYEKTTTEEDGQTQETWTAVGVPETVETKTYGDETVNVITLAHNQKAVLTGIPAGTDVTVTELTTDGYAVKWVKDSADHLTYAITGTIAPGGTEELLCVNTTGVELPETGGMGTQVYVTVGTTLMLGAGLILIEQERRRRRSYVK